jgi:hypothetical protein
LKVPLSTEFFFRSSTTAESAEAKTRNPRPENRGSEAEVIPGIEKSFSDRFPPPASLLF